jgi:hypothetical protein
VSAESTDKNLTPKKRQPNKKDAQKVFLASFSQNANVLVSARAAGVSRQTVYSWLEHDEDFHFAYNQAKEDAKDVLRAEIYRRAVEGWEEDVYQLAKFAGTVRKYDTTLLIFHAKMLMPEYRDKQQVDLHTNSTKDLQAVQEAIAQALSPYPEAGIAVAAALAEMEKARGN